MLQSDTPPLPSGTDADTSLGATLIDQAIASSGQQKDIETELGGPSKKNAAKVGGIAADRLRSLVERIERLEEERKALGGDIRDIFVEAKSAGFDVKVLRALLRIRKQEPADVEEQETLLDVYRRALGM